MTPRRMVPPQKKQISKGSPPSGEPVFLSVGKLRRAHGIKGEIIMEILTDFPERLAERMVYLGEEHTPMQITGLRTHVPNLLIKFAGVDTPESARLLSNQLVYVPVEEIEALPEHTFYHHQLIGLTVKDKSGAILGVLAEVLETGANDVYVVTAPDGSEILLPVIEGVITRVDLDLKEMIANPPAWE